MGALGAIDGEASGGNSPTEWRRCADMKPWGDALVLMLDGAAKPLRVEQWTSERGYQRMNVFKCILCDLVANFKIIFLLVSCSLVLT
jgi:hypothetical protein